MYIKVITDRGSSLSSAHAAAAAAVLQHIQQMLVLKQVSRKHRKLFYG